MSRFTRTLAFAGLALFSAAAHADDLVILSAAAAKKALDPLPRSFQLSTGNQVRFEFGTAGTIHDKVVSGTLFDIVILPPAPLADLVKRGAVVGGMREDLGTVLLAAAIRSGATAPDISSLDALRATLVNAQSIGIADPGTGATSGIYLANLIRKLGIADVVKSKMKVFPDGSAAMEAVARGEVAIGLGQKSEITPIAGVKLIGLLPQSVQLRTVYAAGLATQADNKPSARQLFDSLVSPKSKASFRENGFDQE